MIALIVRRLAALVPLLFIVTFLVFALMALIPGDAAVTLAGGADASREDIERIRSELRLDDPMLIRYGRWVGGVLALDLGDSLYTGQPVIDELGARVPVTLAVAGAALFFTVPMVLVFGVLSGLWAGGTFDRVVLLASSLGIAVPSFWLGILLIIAFSVQLGWLPPFGYTSFSADPIGWLARVTMPALALATTMFAVLTRQLRNALADTLTAAYVRTAWAKGGTAIKVVLGHGLKNAAMPVVTVTGLQVSTLLGGSVIIEQIFLVPGVGMYLLRAINMQDVPVIQGVVLVFVILNVVVNLLVDITYGFLNPKVRAT